MSPFTPRPGNTLYEASGSSSVTLSIDALRPSAFYPNGDGKEPPLTLTFSINLRKQREIQEELVGIGMLALLVQEVAALHAPLNLL